MFMADLLHRGFRLSDDKKVGSVIVHFSGPTLEYQIGQVIIGLFMSNLVSQIFYVTEAMQLVVLVHVAFGVVH